MEEEEEECGWSGWLCLAPVGFFRELLRRRATPHCCWKAADSSAAEGEDDTEADMQTAAMTRSSTQWTSSSPHTNNMQPTRPHGDLHVHPISSVEHRYDVASPLPRSSQESTSDSELSMPHSAHCGCEQTQREREESVGCVDLCGRLLLAVFSARHCRLQLHFSRLQGMQRPGQKKVKMSQPHTSHAALSDEVQPTPTKPERYTYTGTVVDGVG